MKPINDQQRIALILLQGMGIFMLPKKYGDGLFMYTTTQPTQQLQLPICVKTEFIPQPRKRVAIVSVKLVKEASLYYANRTIRNPRDGAT